MARPVRRWLGAGLSMVLLLSVGAAAGDRAGPAGVAPPDLVYGYDELGRLASVTDPEAGTAVYRYDPAGNVVGVERVPAGQAPGVEVASAEPPAVVGLSPAVVHPGEAVTILGERFTGDPMLDQVVIGDASYATVESASPSELVARISAVASSGRVSVATPDGTGYGSDLFVIPWEAYGADDVAAATRAALGESVSVALDAPGQVALVVFDGRAGQQVALDATGGLVCFGLTAPTIGGFGRGLPALTSRFPTLTNRFPRLFGRLPGTRPPTIRPTPAQLRGPGGVSRPPTTSRPPARALCSFDGDTPVLLADGTTTPMSDVQPGDLVLATDPQTGEQGPGEVTHTLVHDDTLVDLQLDGGSTVTTTEDHPFWNHTDQRWQPATTLDPGDQLLTPTGDTVTVAGIDPESGRSDLAYNLTVDGLHTYYVLADYTPVLVHNDGCVRVSAGQQAPGTLRMTRAEQQFVSDLLNAKPNLQIYRTTPGAGQGDFLVIDLSNPRSPVGWVVELKSSRGAFAGNQLANSEVLAQQFGLTQLERVTGTPEQILQVMNRGRGGWPR